MIDLDHVADSERTSRFIVEKSKFTASTGRIRNNAFVPPADGALSVYRTDGLQEQEVWHLGNEYVASEIGRPILARGDLPAGEFTKRNLKFDPDRIPHERHCNIINWPSESDWLKTATELANAAKLVVAP